MSKQDYSISIIDKSQCASILDQYHYLKDISKGFKTGINYGLFKGNQLLGVCIFTGLPVPELLKGMYGLNRSDQEGFFELSRLCVDPSLQGSEHNITSWFVSRCLKKLKKENYVRSILSYADESYHQGTIYKACNFKYYGLTDKKKDFWFLNDDGSYTKHTRGKIKGKLGEWRDRTRKHRFVMQYDNTLTMKWLQKKKTLPK